MEWMRTMMRHVAHLVAAAVAGFCVGIFAAGVVAAIYPEATIQLGLKLAAFHADYDFAAAAREPILQQERTLQKGRDRR
jgi:hypothetical protein